MSVRSRGQFMRSVQDNSFLRRMGQLLPVDMTKRFRLLIMLLAMSSTLTIWPVITSADDTSVLLRVLQLGLLSAVFWRWTVWYRTGIVRNRDLALELPAVLAIAYLLPDPASILTFVYTGVYFRPLFTNNRDTAVASGAYVMTYLGGMALAATQTGS